MDGCHISIRSSLLKVAICLVFIGFFARVGHAQLGAPYIVVQPVGISVQNGGTATILATAASLTPMKLYWYCNGQPVPTTNTSVVNLNVVLGTQSTLTINNFSSANAGSYSLRVTNASNLSAVSDNATVIVVVSTVSNVVNFVSSGIGLTAKGFNIQLSAPTGSNVVIQASTDCKTWVPISTNTATGGSVSYTDTAAVSLPLRYYRALIK
jgi:Immunoglobulin domain